MKHLKGAFRATLASLALAACASPVQARITVDALGGELEVEGFLKSEVRSRLGSGPAYLGQWIQRLQVEAFLNYENVGIFDELTFAAIVRPEYDIVQDMGDFSSNRIGDGTTEPSLQDRAEFTFANEGLAFGGFDAFFGDGSFTTGGINKIVTQGFQNPAWLAENFEVDFRRSPITRGNVQFNPGPGPFLGGGVNQPGGGFPLVVQKSSNLDLDCNRCVDLNVDNIDVAMANTDSNGRLYPFRELYVDAVAGDWWIRLGKQQVVWGKTDFFRLQDLINPVDFGQHFFFDSFEDIRIPQWMASVQYKAGSFGPLTDNAIQVVWNFDEFQQVGLGNPSSFWAHPFAKDISTFAIFNTYFSVEPCVSGGTALTAFGGGVMLPQDVCGAAGPNDPRKPSGFGTPAGLNVNNRPHHDIDNTEAGWRWEFRVSDFRFALSHWYGWNDLPVFKFHTVNTVAALTAGGVAAANNITVADLTFARLDQATITPGVTDLVAAGRLGAYTSPGSIGGAVPVISQTPQAAALALAGSPIAAYRTAARNAIASGNFAPLWTGTDPALSNGLNVVGVGPVLGGQTSMEYKQAHTLGLAMDYFESWSGVVARIESSWTFDELVNNTRSVDWVDKSDVMRFSLGFDRPTFIPFLNKTRTFFLSLQIFDTWYWDHEGDKNTGYFTDEHNWITTFFFIGNYMRDKLKPIGFYVWDEASNSHVAGFNTEWLIDNHWSIKGGVHIIWEGDENLTHDTGPFTTFITPGSDGQVYPYVTSVFGPARQGIGALRNYDELFFELKYQF